MKIPGFNLRPPVNLAVYWENKQIHLMSFSEGHAGETVSIFLHECLENTLKKKIEEYLLGKRFRKTILILQRSVVIQKEIVLQGGAEALKSAIAEKLPYASEEMAYGISLGDKSSKGLLYAVPEKKLRESLDFLERIGLRVDEVITEDQVLAWLPDDSTKLFLLLSRDATRDLFLLAKEGRVFFSQSFLRDELNLENIASEIFTAFENGFDKPEAVYFSGEWGEAEIVEIRKNFECPILYLPDTKRSNREAPSVLFGVLRWGKFPWVSLLPTSEKIRIRILEHRKLIKETVFAACLLFGVFFLAFNSHLLFLKQKSARIDQLTAHNAPQLREIKKIASQLRRLDEAESSKEKIISLLKELALRMPSGIKLKDLQAESGGIQFSGESPSQSTLNETVQVFEGIKNLTAIKLEHTRLRKKLGQDYIEFEVNASWSK